MRLLTTFTLYSGTDFNHVPWVWNINTGNVYLQTKLITGGAGHHFTLVSQPAESGGGGAPAARICSRQRRVLATETREATGTGTAGGSFWSQYHLKRPETVPGSLFEHLLIYSVTECHISAPRMSTFFIKYETRHVECKSCSFVEVMFSYTRFIHAFPYFFGGLLFVPDSFTPFGFAPRVSHIIWLTPLSIAHHLA